MSRFITTLVFTVLFVSASVVQHPIESNSLIPFLNVLSIANGATTTSFPVYDSDEIKHDPDDLKQMIKGKWIVVYVLRDGETTPAQFGQKIGDVITLKKEGGVTEWG